MRIDVIGAGPAGLMTSILLRRRLPQARLRVVERLPVGQTDGWGVVFPQGALRAMSTTAPDIADTVLKRAARWERIRVRHREHQRSIVGNTFHGIARADLLEILEDAARAAAVEIEHGVEVEPGLSGHEAADLVVGADGIGSVVRASADFGARLRPGSSRYAWFGVTRSVATFDYIFRETPWGLFRAYVYPSSRDWSTLIVHLDEDTWSRVGLDCLSPEEGADLCREILAEDLDDAEILGRDATWNRFPHLSCRRWSTERSVLLGDAAHTTHWSIGSGTRLAVEDAIALADALGRSGGVDPAALGAYEAVRRPVVERFQHAARLSEWYFENLDRNLDTHPVQFAYQVMTRSWRMTHGDVARRDPAFSAEVDAWFYSQATGTSVDLAPAPSFAPLRQAGLHLTNRLVASPGVRGAGIWLSGPDDAYEDVSSTDVVRARRYGTDRRRPAVPPGALDVGLLDLTAGNVPVAPADVGTRMARFRADRLEKVLGVVLSVPDRMQSLSDVTTRALAAVEAGATLVLLEPEVVDGTTLVSHARVVQAAEMVRRETRAIVAVDLSDARAGEADAVIASGRADLCLVTLPRRTE